MDGEFLIDVQNEQIILLTLSEEEATKAEFVSENLPEFWDDETIFWEVAA